MNKIRKSQIEHMGKNLSERVRLSRDVYDSPKISSNIAKLHKYTLRGRTRVLIENLPRTFEDYLNNTLPNKIESFIEQIKIAYQLMFMRF